MLLCASAVFFQVVVPILDQPGIAPLCLSDIELCTEATVRVPTVRAISATSGTRAVGSPPLVYYKALVPVRTYLSVWLGRWPQQHPLLFKERSEWGTVDRVWQPVWRVANGEC